MRQCNRQSADVSALVYYVQIDAIHVAKTRGSKVFPSLSISTPTLSHTDYTVPSSVRNGSIEAKVLPTRG